MKTVDIAFVILTWNSESYLEGCLNSLVSSLHSSEMSFEIFIVDNGSADKTVELLKRIELLNNNIYVIYLSENIGTTKSRNMALKKVSSRYICILDSDIEIENNIFPILISTINSNNHIGIVVPRLCYPSGKWQKSVDQFPTLLHKLKRFFFLRRLEAKEGGDSSCVNEERLVDYAISAFWLIKREAFEAVGLLDENYFYAPEDVDYCLSMWKAGYGIVYQPQVKVIHHTQEISRGFKLNKAKLEHIKGLAYFFYKHFYFFRKPKFFNFDFKQ